jgi:inner membrane protein
MKTNKNFSFLNSYSVKMVVVIALALLLMIPTYWIQKIIDERITLKENVENEMASQWGHNQTISAMVLNIPFTYMQEREKEPAISVTSVAHFLPQDLKVSSTLQPELRKRGIYKIPVYRSKIKISGSFPVPDFGKIDHQVNTILWDQAYFTTGISDLSGIEEMPLIRINHVDCPMEPGVPNSDLFNHGITFKPGSIDLTRAIDFSLELNLKGSKAIEVDALGKSSEIDISSTWTNPSFIGSFLPSEREINNKGFNANWKVTYLNRNFPQQWAGDKYQIYDSRLGVSLLLPVDHYQKSTRSVKYAILFIALNFIVFLFIEIRNRKPMHPFQYSLVAFALLLFYTLLTAIGEQIGFNAAFAISAFAITALISWYSYSIMKSIKTVIWIFLLQSGLYIFLFTILQLQDYALLMGSIGLFIILGLIMKASQEIKWYNDQQE